MSEVAVITGGASGFGLALGDRCAAQGMSVALLDIDGVPSPEPPHWRPRTAWAP